MQIADADFCQHLWLWDVVGNVALLSFRQRPVGVLSCYVCYHVGVCLVFQEGTRASGILTCENVGGLN